jgi:LysM repeat protein/uncharacterized protein YkwD
MSAMCFQTKWGLDPVQSQTKLIRTTLVIFCTLIIAFSTAFPAAAQDGAFSTPAQQILAEVNQARIDNGLPPLAVSPMLDLAAQRHVEDVVANGNWGHYGSDGSNIQLRVARVGYPTSSVSENWVAVSDPSQAIGWWMNDWIHRVNILEPRWDEIGVGAAQASNGYWILVTDFGNIDGDAMPPVVESAPVTQLTAAADISVEAAPANGEYTIQGGDTLLGIAIRFGLDWQDIALANAMSENDLLQIGDTIRLPMLNGGGGDQASGTGGAVAGKKTHVIRTGETLWTISARYQVAWQDIAAVNDLGEYDLLQIGQELKLPASLDEPEEQPEAQNEDAAAATEGEAAEQPADTPTAAATDAPPDDEGVRFAQKNAAPASNATYTVQSGDTLLAIAINQDVSWQELADLNNLDEDSFLQIGQTLKLPGGDDTVQITLAGSNSEASESANPAAFGRVHSVEAGDTVYGIALQYNVDWEELLRLNNLDEDSLLQLGQELKLP